MSRNERFTRTYNRSGLDDYESSNKKQKSSVSAEVQKILNSGDDEATIMAGLRQKYKDTEMIEVIFDLYKSKHKNLKKLVIKFRAYTSKKFAFGKTSDAQIYKTARSFAKKKGLSTPETDTFMGMVFDVNYDPTHRDSLPSTKMSKTLGYDRAISSMDKLNVATKDLGIVQNILTLKSASGVLHSSVIKQSLLYTDCAPEVLQSSLADREIATEQYNMYAHIHPIIALLFAPKFRIFEERMLLSNIGNIIESKQNGTTLRTKPDMELYGDLISDPNDVVCSTQSAISDLLNRFTLQTVLWKEVLQFRQGKFYSGNLKSFLQAIEKCSDNIYDSTDLTYVRDEGTIVRRIMNAFSLRPTIVSTSSIYGMQASIPMASGVGVLSTTASYDKLTSIPMITLRLPLQVKSDSVGVSLSEAFSQHHLFIENKKVVPKIQSVLHSRDVIIFYVCRRYKTVNITSMQRPYSFRALPMTIGGWESLNTHTVNYDPVINVVDDTFKLRSVLFIESSPENKKLIIGCSTGIVVDNSGDGQYQEDGYVIYDPQGSSTTFQDANGSYKRNEPFTYISGEPTFGSEDDKSFRERATKCGTIFVYQKIDGVGGPCVATRSNSIYF